MYTGKANSNGGGGTRAFTTSGRNIIAPNGSAFQPRGVNVWADAGEDLSNVYVDIPTYLPGINFVRAYYDDRVAGCDGRWWGGRVYVPLR